MWIVVLFRFLVGTAPAATVQDLGWPATTQSARTRVAAKVRDRPNGDRIGKLPRGERIGFTEVARSARGRCREWVAIAPRGWVCAKDLAPSDDAPALTLAPRKLHAAVSGFAGVDLSASPEPARWGWASGDVLAAPRRRAARVRRLAPRTIVPVLEMHAGFIRIADGEWVNAKHVRAVAAAPRPDGVADDARWIDVDLDQQVLVAYQGDTPVYATLVSTGKHGWTPVGVYRITRKVALATMADAARRWDYHDVPYITYFRKDYALHGAWWHDDFGHTSSVGCVNLSPSDARWVFAFTAPALPDGWEEVRGGIEEGTVVRIRDRRHPSPPRKDILAY